MFKQGYRMRTVVWGTTIAGIALVAAADGPPGGGDPTCVENLDNPACNYYIDGTPKCPDVTFGGGQCDVKTSAEGLSSVTPSNVSCLVATYSKNSEGDCTFTGIHVISVSCSRASGEPCG